jgi:cobaltochelatase CobS
VTAAPSGDAFAAFQALIASMAPSVDAAQVREIVKDEIGSVVFPTRTVTVRESGERHEHEGLTHCQLADVIGILASGEHVMMVGPAGTGKSTIAHQASEAIGLRYFAISVCPTTPESKIFGYNDANGVYHGTAFRDAFENGGVFNFDEIDNGHPSILAAINSALANGVCAFPDGMVKRSPEFRCVATANTYGRGADRKYVGRQSLDAATLDRFTMLHIDIDEALEQAICAGIADATTVSKVLGFVRPVRARADSQAMAVVVSPRASIGMCRLIGQGGFTFDRAVDMRVRRGLSDADWRKLTA